MSKLIVDQKTIKDLFQDKKADFLIPDYQRPYAWGEKECQTLWDDIFNFAIPNAGATPFDSNSEYFLGPIITFKGEETKGKIEVIDGQQRLTTLMLLLRAFYDRFAFMKDKSSVLTRENIAKCIWKTDEFDEPDKTNLKIDSEVATDNDKAEFMFILKNGEPPKEQKSAYAKNYRFFMRKIDEFLSCYPTFCAYLPTRIMNNCILLPIEAESQDTALRIFSTLNDRGKPLSDADIFKAQFYKYYSSLGKKDDFIKDWKALDVVCDKVFHPISGTPMDELFTRYMYYARAKQGIKLTTTEALRKFYEKDEYSLLKQSLTFENLKELAAFWEDVSNQDQQRFSMRVLRRLFVLNYAPNGMWTYFVSVYFMQNKDVDGMLDDDAFYKFLEKITAFIWAYALTNPGVNALRTPVYAEMVNVVNGVDVTFSGYKFDEAKLRSIFANTLFSNARPITKSIITWWAFEDAKQTLPSIDTVFEIEHIYARNRYDKEKSLSNPNNIDALGNKAMLEKHVNIRASDYKFADKVKFYNGFTTANKQKKAGTKVAELLELAKTKTDFVETDIIARTKKMVDAFIKFLKHNDLVA